MKIISYNTYKCTQSKIDHILGMGADLYVLPECASKEHISLPEGYDMLWCGDDDLTGKGLGVIWKKHLAIHVIPEYKKIKHLLPIIVEGAGFPKFILAAWPTLYGRRRRHIPSCCLKHSKRTPSILTDSHQWLLGTSTATLVKAV